MILRFNYIFKVSCSIGKSCIKFPLEMSLSDKLVVFNTTLIWPSLSDSDNLKRHLMQLLPHFKKIKWLFENQHLLLLRDI